MSTGKRYPLKRVLYAYHEAGHAVVWHAVNGLIDVISIDSDPAGYKGYCRFGFRLHTEDDPLESDDSWSSSGRIHPKTVMAYYAGMLAMAYYCASYGGEDDYLGRASRTIWSKSIPYFSVSALMNSSVQP